MFKVKYQLGMEDYLVHQLYNASISPRVIKKRKNSRILITIVYLGISTMILFQNESTIIGTAALLFAIAWFFFYPKFSAWRYKRHYTRHIEEQFKNLMNVDVEFTLGDHYVTSTVGGSEAKISIKEVHGLIELKEHFLVQLKTGSSLIIPISVIDDLKVFRQHFLDLDLAYTDKKNWFWA